LALHERYLLALHMLVERAFESLAKG